MAEDVVLVEVVRDGLAYRLVVNEVDRKVFDPGRIGWMQLEPKVVVSTTEPEP